MDDTRIQTTTSVEIDGRSFVLHGDRDHTEVLADIEAAAARADPTFVRLISGDETVSVLISSRTRVVVTVRRDTADHGVPEAPMFPANIDWDL